MADTFPEGWASAAVKPGAPGWYERRYSDGVYAHYWTGQIWSSTKDGNAHWRQLADAPYPLWRAIPTSGVAIPPALGGREPRLGHCQYCDQKAGTMHGPYCRGAGTVVSGVDSSRGGER